MAYTFLLNRLSLYRHRQHLLRSASFMLDSGRVARPSLQDLNTPYHVVLVRIP